jgi:hypothetical protein
MHLDSGLTERIKHAVNADLRRVFQQEAMSLDQRLDHTLLGDLVPSVISDVLKTRDENENSRSPIFGFNGQKVRAAILLRLIRSIEFDAFVETGTFHGETCALIAGQTTLPIYSCDLKHRIQPLATVLSELLNDRFTLRLMDSREFLRQFFAEGLSKRPFFYLDAHWEADIPLLEELQIIMNSANEFAVVIDDFKVPGDPGFGFDVYGEKVFNWSYISPVMEVQKDRIGVFYPAYPSISETGAKRGFILLASKSLTSAISEHIGPELMTLDRTI